MADATGRSDMARGIELAQQGQREAAYATLRKAIFSEGDSALLRLWLSTVAPTTAETVQHLERALMLEPGDPAAENALNLARQRLAEETGTPLPPTAPAPTLTGHVGPPEPADAPFAAWDRSVAPAPSGNSDRGLAEPADAPFAAWDRPAAPPEAVHGTEGLFIGAPESETPWSSEDIFPGVAPIPGPHEPHSVLGHVARPGEEQRKNTPTYLTDAAPSGLEAGPREYGVIPASAAIRDIVEVAPVRVPANGRPGPVLPAPPPATGAPAAHRPARRRMAPLLRGLLALVGIVVLLALLFSSGIAGAALSAFHPSGADLTRTAQTTAAQTATAQAVAAAASAQAATQTAIPAATAQAVAALYRAQVNPLIQALRDQDGDVVNVVHQADDGLLSPEDAAQQVATFTQQNADFKTQADHLAPPPDYREHQSQVAGAIALRGQALDSATQYLQNLQDVAPAAQAEQDAQQSYQDAGTAYANNKSQGNYANLLRAKQALDNADGQLTRLRTYADQAHQQFLTFWDRYHGALPENVP